MIKMGDIYCAKCGEPWEAYGVYHGDLEPDEREKFLNGEGCPCCDFGKKCPACNGTGKQRCERCWGEGVLTFYYPERHTEPCPVCDGKGFLDEPCEKCGGSGKPGENKQEFLESALENTDEPDELLFRFL
ncbi:hypothetical protein DRP07_02220 [Archaeoglobales archaeon]|nr:MAG: hypothetical protein DRP07_02220 [Archaeoglobales archaeon]